jgi:DNA modification methylase
MKGKPKREQGPAGVVNRNVALGLCYPHPNNYNFHGPDQVARLRESVRTFGQVRSVVVQDDGAGRFLEVAGHGVMDAMRLEGMAEARADVIPSDWTPVMVRAYLAADNELARLGLPDDAQLAALVDGIAKEADERLAALAAGTEDRLRELREALAQSAPLEDVEPQIDRADELRKKWGTATGQLWQLGEHRLLCGDSTKREDVERVMDESFAMVMATDPPYGVAYDNAERPHPGVAKPRVANDELTDGPAMQDFLERMIKAALPNMNKHAAFYFWHPMLTQGTYVAAAAAGILIHRQIIWVKPVLLLGRGDYHWRHELCFYGWQKGNRPPFYGPRNQDTIWQVGSVTQAERKAMNHATPKPVGLWDKPILNHTKPGEICYEPFLGSGTTIIACEKLGRECRAIEISPAYVAVSMQRFMDATGKTPVLIGDGKAQGTGHKSQGAGRNAAPRGAGKKCAARG